MRSLRQPITLFVFLPGSSSFYEFNRKKKDLEGQRVNCRYFNSMLFSWTLFTQLFDVIINIIYSWLILIVKIYKGLEGGKKCVNL